MNSLPVYEPTVGAMCPHGEPDCLCDVKITTRTVVNVNIKHDFHALVLEDMDDYYVSARNIYDFMCRVLGCFEYLQNIENPRPVRKYEPYCEICGVALPDMDIRRLTCSNKCRCKKRRMKAKGLL